MMKFSAVAAAALLQTIRQPIYSILLLLAFAVLVLSVSLTGYSLETDMAAGDTRLLVDFGLSTVMVLALFIAAFSAAAVLTREIEHKTVLTVVSKPVSRPIILLGKFAGVAAAVTVAFYLMSIVFLLTVRHGVVSRATTPYDPVVIAFGVGALVATIVTAMACNYLFGWQVTSTGVWAGVLLFTIAAGVVGGLNHQWKPTPFGEGVDPQIVVVLSLLWMATLVLTALAVAVSTRLSRTATLMACLAVFVVGVISESQFRPAAEDNPVAMIAYRITPNLSYFFNLDALTMGRTITGRYVALAAVYAVCYSAALLGLGTVLFQNREMDARASGSMAPMMVNIFAWYLRLASAVVAIAGLSMLVAAEQGRAMWIAAGVVVAAPLLWALAGSIGRGDRWALQVLWLLVGAQLIGAVVVVGFGHGGQFDPLVRAALLTATAVQAAFVLAMSVRRTTLDHFGLLRSATASRRRAQAQP